MFNPAAAPQEIGRFQGIRLLGFGGVGVVFEVYDPQLDRRVALKLCRTLGPAAEAALRREARLLAQLDHPNVVTVHEVGRYRGELFYVMELIVGRSAHDYFCECETWREAVDLYLAAGSGLVAAHARGIVHGDFKPANVLVGADGRVRIADFGLARALAEHDPGWLGTPAFMAPERLRGEAGDERSDVFSYCVSLWQLLFGTRPFRGETQAELLASIVAGDRRIGEALPRVPWRLRAILDRGLAPDPKDRPASMHALLAEIHEVRHRSPRHRLLGYGLVGLLGVGLGGLLEDRRTQEADALERAQSELSAQSERSGVLDRARSASSGLSSQSAAGCSKR